MRYGGQAVFEGSGQAASDEGAAQYVRRQGNRSSYGSPAYDSFLLSGAVRAIADDPGSYLRRVGRRARLLLPCLIVLLVWRRWRSRTLIPVAAAAATIIPYLLIGDDTRFYLPAAFAYIILIAMAVEVALTYVRQRMASTRPESSAHALPSGPARRRG